MRSSRSWPALALAGAWLAGCGEPYPEREMGIGAGPEGTFFVWERDPREPWTPPTRAWPLAAGATVHVGFTGGGCVGSLVPEHASSECGEIVGVSSGWTQLLALSAGGRLRAHAPLRVAEPTGVDVYVYVRLEIDGRSVTVAAGANPEEPVAVPFAGDVEVLALARDASGPLLGVAPVTLDVSPHGALAVESYGRYFRFVCALTGSVDARFAQGRGTPTPLLLDCLEPGDGEGEP